ncbi:beta-lactamase family protein [bacterium]|nr:beta-lactamase family protein [bacterium]
MSGATRSFLRSCLCLLLIAGVPGSSTGTTPVAPFQAELDALRREYGFPGATAAYVLPDGTCEVAATGFSDSEHGTPMTPQSRMLSASIGKTYLAALAVALSDAGHIDLDAPISQWLGNRPWFSRLPNHRTITLRQLLNHSSGLPNHVYSAQFAADVAHLWQKVDNEFTPQRLIQYSLDQEPLFAAGSGWAYTDSGYILAGLVLETATGRNCFADISTRFLAPLGLTRTSPADRRDLPGLAAGYLAADNRFGLPPKTTDDDGTLRWHPGLEWAGGGWVSTSCDLARWGAALFGGRILPNQALADLLQAIPTDPDDETIHYGAGVAIYHSGPYGPVYGHGGWIPGYSSSLRYYPDHGVTIAFQLNTDIGIIDGTTNVMTAMELRLATVAITSAGHHQRARR